MQEALNHWEGGLCTLGGALVPSKSHWYLVNFKWTNGSWKYCSTAYELGGITMQDHLGNRVPLERVEVTKAQNSQSNNLR